MSYILTGQKTQIIYRRKTMLNNENHQSSSEEKVLLEDVSFEDLFLSSAIELAMAHRT